MPSKYGDLVKTLPRLEPTGEWQEKVNEAKSKYRNLVGKPAEAARQLAKFKRGKEILEARVKAANIEIAAVEQIMWSGFEDSAIESLRIKEGLVSVFDEISVKIVDREAFHKWIRSHKLARLFSVHAQTAASLVKDRLTSKRPAPPGVEVGTFKRTRITKS